MTTVIDLPAIRGWKQCAFDPIRPAFVSQMQGRRTERIATGTPYWVASYESVHLTYEDFGKVDAFRMLADAGAVFKAYDPMRMRPIAYDKHDGRPLSGTKAGGGAFDGTATLSGVINATQIVVSGLPVGFKVLPGDYLSIQKSALVVSLHRVVSAAQANGFGVLTVSILHPLDTQHFTSGQTVHFEKPYCLMQVDPSSWSLPKPAIGERSISFSAQEVFFYD